MLNQIITKLSEGDEEDVGTLLDIIADNMDNPEYDKYKELLKSKYGVDWKKSINDDFYIENASLNDIKDKKDFRSYDKYIKYCKEIYHLRGIKQAKYPDKEIDVEKARAIGEKLGFEVRVREYSGQGNLAQAREYIEMPETLDVGSFIHEAGHIYDNLYYKDGVSKISTNAVSSYDIGNGGEVFAENFLHYFIAPDLLKKHLPEVYRDLDKRISSKWKKVIIDEVL